MFQIDNRLNCLLRIDNDDNHSGLLLHNRLTKWYETIGLSAALFSSVIVPFITNKQVDAYDYFSNTLLICCFICSINTVILCILYVACITYIRLNKIRKFAIQFKSFLPLPVLFMFISGVLFLIYLIFYFRNLISYIIAPIISLSLSMNICLFVKIRTFVFNENLNN